MVRVEAARGEDVTRGGANEEVVSMVANQMPLRYRAPMNRRPPGTIPRPKPKPKPKPKRSASPWSSTDQGLGRRPTWRSLTEPGVS